MPRDYTLAPKLKLIVDHLKAVRTLDEYVNGVGLKKDMQDFTNYLQQDLRVEVWIPLVDGRRLVMPRHTQPEPDVQALLNQIRITLPPQPPPRIKASQFPSKTRRPPSSL